MTSKRKRTTSRRRIDINIEPDARGGLLVNGAPVALCVVASKRRRRPKRRTPRRPATTTVVQHGDGINIAAVNMTNVGKEKKNPITARDISLACAEYLEDYYDDNDGTRLVPLAIFDGYEDTQGSDASPEEIIVGETTSIGIHVESKRAYFTPEGKRLGVPQYKSLPSIDSDE